MSKRYTLEQLKKKVKQIEDYLGPRLGYSFENWPDPYDKNYWPIRWIMEYCIFLKERYYRRLKRKKGEQKC